MQILFAVFLGYIDITEASSTSLQKRIDLQNSIKSVTEENKLIKKGGKLYGGDRYDVDDEDERKNDGYKSDTTTTTEEESEDADDDDDDADSDDGGDEGNDGGNGGGSDTD